MSLVIVSRDVNTSLELTQILQHYFPCQKSLNTDYNQLRVQNKYYSCNVPIINVDHHLRVKSIPQEQLTELSSQQSKQKQCGTKPQKCIQVNGNKKVDFLIFIFDWEEILDGTTKMTQLVDKTINQLQPESFLICVSVNETIQSQINNGGNQKWRYEQQIAGCENFISVIYVNLANTLKTRPIWSQGGLLAHEEVEHKIFEILDIIQTTVWTNAENMGQKKEDPKKIEYLQAKEKQKIQDEYQDSCGQQDEQKLQKQMQEFESLMQQMMSINSTSGNQRKIKATNLIMKLTKNLDL